MLGSGSEKGGKGEQEAFVFKGKVLEFTGKCIQEDPVGERSSSVAGGLDQLG